MSTTKIPVSLYAEATPNPNVMKFTANKMLVDTHIYEFNNRAEAIDSPLALELFGFSFVDSVFISKNFVSVSKKVFPRNNRAINKNILNAPSRSITTQIDTVYSQSSRSNQTEEKAQEKDAQEKDT